MNEGDSCKKAQINLADSYDEQIAIRLPLSWRWDKRYIDSLPYIFGFSVAVTALEARAGDIVLDFACGSGWISEWLNRLGIRTVSLDISSTLLGFGRRRMSCDERIDLSEVSAHFVAGDERLPFSDGAFDGIICMNSLHHMQDYQAVLDEMYRVLNQNGKASFFEPGSNHALAPASIKEMEGGILEKNVVLSDIYEKARSAGFEELHIKPYLQPTETDFTYSEWRDLAGGNKKSVAEYVERLCDYVEKTNLIFTLSKTRQRVPDSKSPGRLSAVIEILEAPASASAGAEVCGKAAIRNAGDTIWLSEQTRFGGYVTFAARLLTPDGKLLVNDFGRALLPRDIMPGDGFDAVMFLRAPSEGGEYALEFDMVCEMIKWFGEDGSATVSTAMRVF
ncbi:MAG: hypothetical protein A2X93_08000 [Deltaproteobacteria bacterium GWC2_56_8]|nr:MAG: hypothetical protein A2X93_08000 [Deltaproteobacteria bacterium GWC2_56_8]